LIENGADVNQATKTGATALVFALYVGEIKIAKLIMKKDTTTKLILEECEEFELIEILDQLCKE
jgi:ankyrin repeat protein